MKDAEKNAKTALRDVRFIRQPDHYIVFHSNSFKVVKLKLEMGEALAALQERESVESIAKRMGLSESDITDGLDGFTDALAEFPALPEQVRQPDKPTTLYLNVSNACNLKCAYCYANGGSYDSAPGMMSRETAVLAIDRFMDSLPSVGSIIFFGGEPLLRGSLLPEVCDYAKAAAVKRNLPVPSFTIVTNGTLLNAENVAFLAEYKFSITISLDGPQEINDVLRPMNTGNGSFTKIAEGLRLLKQVGINVNIESTFTAEHLRREITPKKLLEFLRNDFGIRSALVAPVASTPGSDISLSDFYDRFIPEFREAVRYSLESLNSDNPIVLFHVRQTADLLLRKIKKPSTQLCYTHLGRELFSVSSVGNIYPCQMMTDRKEFEMGNISDPEFAAREKFSKVQEVFDTMNRQMLQCRDCWARHTCFICIAGVELETKKLKPIPRHRCDLIFNITDEVLIYLSKIHSDPAKWDQFCTNLYA